MTLVLSPHLDDAVFSSGGLLASLSDSLVRVVTCFTQSVPNPTGFALACQLDKGLTPEVDYMALRRAEDERALALLGLHPEHWDFPEAPHRGYHSAAELFAGIHPADDITDQLTPRIRGLLYDYRPTLLLYPLGAGNHVDHLQLIKAVDALRPLYEQMDFVQYYDQPYTHRHPAAYPKLELAPDWSPEEQIPRRQTVRYPVPADDLRRKYAASLAYTTQIGFQFGDAGGMEQLLGTQEYYYARRATRRPVAGGGDSLPF